MTDRLATLTARFAALKIDLDKAEGGEYNRDLSRKIFNEMCDVDNAIACIEMTDEHLDAETYHVNLGHQQRVAVDNEIAVRGAF
jgi:hypothetical protein